MTKQDLVGLPEKVRLAIEAGKAAAAACSNDGGSANLDRVVIPVPGLRASQLPTLPGYVQKKSRYHQQGVRLHAVPVQDELRHDHRWRGSKEIADRDDLTSVRTKIVPDKNAISAKLKAERVHNEAVRKRMAAGEDCEHELIPEPAWAHLERGESSIRIK
ncbi:hypothetical protein [Pseudomonas alkylphenolica]|jgi:hypothetical protein|uniref:hypothetical protein n=1 Tax=Pseudomonas alkylphenolica TaxID=237609 RepID=UPI001E330B19|nr:hypothetical protein [Pseudomonas alkylphenolica]